MLDPVIAHSDYLYKQICKILFYFLEIHSIASEQGWCFVCQQEVFSGGNISFGTGSVSVRFVCELRQMDRAEHWAVRVVCFLAEPQRCGSPQPLSFQAITELDTFSLFRKQSCDLCADQGQQSIFLGCWLRLGANFYFTGFCGSAKFLHSWVMSQIDCDWGTWRRF